MFGQKPLSRKDEAKQLLELAQSYTRYPSTEGLPSEQKKRINQAINAVLFVDEASQKEKAVAALTEEDCQHLDTMIAQKFYRTLYRKTPTPGLNHTAGSRLLFRLQHAELAANFGVGTEHSAPLVLQAALQNQSQTPIHYLMISDPFQEGEEFQLNGSQHYFAIIGAQTPEEAVAQLRQDAAQCKPNILVIDAKHGEIYPAWEAVQCNENERLNRYRFAPRSSFIHVESSIPNPAKTAETGEIEEPIESKEDNEDCDIERGNCAVKTGETKENIETEETAKIDVPQEIKKIVPMIASTPYPRYQTAVKKVGRDILEVRKRIAEKKLAAGQQAETILTNPKSPKESPSGPNWRFFRTKTAPKLSPLLQPTPKSSHSISFCTALFVVIAIVKLFTMIMDYIYADEIARSRRVVS